MGNKMVIGLASGSIMKLATCSIVAGGAVALEMEVDIYLLLQGAYAFKKDVVEKKRYLCDQPELKEKLLTGLAENKIPFPYDYLRELKENGNVRIHACVTAGKVWGARELGDFVDLVDDIVGIAEYVTRAEEAAVHIVF
ncbi:MAG: DsrE/DsrF/DrsH-like family protein [Desulfotomaculales bacterium]